MLSFHVHGLSDIGCTRNSNEDYIAWRTSNSHQTALCILADGVGGYNGGAEASRTAVDIFQHQMAPLLMNSETKTRTDIESAMLLAGAEAHNKIRQARAENAEFAKMGTTLVAVLAYKDHATVLHAGDSRCYLLSDKKNPQIKQLTRDDSVVQAMIDDGTITEQDAPNVPYRNVLTKALGAEQELLYTVRSIDIFAGDQLLLCSDGLYEALNLDEISEAFGQTVSVEQQVQDLIAKSLMNGANDNVSTIVLRARRAS